jgi:hypothetical protein
MPPVDKEVDKAHGSMVNRWVSSKIAFSDCLDTCAILAAATAVAQVTPEFPGGVLDSRVRFPPPPIFIGKLASIRAEKCLSENESENKSAEIRHCPPMSRE